MNKSTISKQRSYLTDLFSTLAVKSHRRSTLWLMLLTLLLLPANMVAQTDYDTSVKFTALAGSPDGNYGETYANLFDGKKKKGDFFFVLFCYTSFQSTNPFPLSSSSMARATTFRLSALNGSIYCLALICSVAASIPPLLLSFSSST